MHIAVVANTAWYLFNFRLKLMHALQGNGHEVTAIAPQDKYASQLQEAGITFIPVDMTGGGTNPLVEVQSVIALARIVRREGIDLIISFTPKGNIYSALACLLQRRQFLPGVSGLGRTFIRRSLVTRVVSALYRFTFRRTRYVLFENRDDLSLFVATRLVRPESAVYVPGAGLDLERFSPTAKGIQSLESPVAGEVRFILVARMLWDKGVGEFVEAARQIRALHPLARFQLLGWTDVDNPAAVPRSTIEQWVNEGTIEYLGTSDDVRHFLSAADCVVLPSYREGLPRTLVEAAAMQRPVITTDTAGCRDTVIDGETGFLCNVRDAGDLAKKVLAFIALSPTQRQQMGIRGRALVEREFDERIVIERYLELVGTLAGEASSRPEGSD